MRPEADLARARERVLLRHNGAHGRRVLAAVVEDECHRRAIDQRRDAARRHVGLDLEIDVVEQGHHRLADGEPCADFGVNAGDDAGIGRLDGGPGEIDLGEREARGRAHARRIRRADGAFGDDHFLLGVLVAALAERGRIAEPFEAAQLLAVKGRLGGHALELRLRLVDDRRQTVALGAEPDRVENGDGLTPLHAVAHLDVKRGNRACGTRRDLARAPRDQAPDHRHRLRHRLHPHLVDGDHGRRLLGRPIGHARAEPERCGGGNAGKTPKDSPGAVLAPAFVHRRSLPLP